MTTLRQGTDQVGEHLPETGDLARTGVSRTTAMLTAMSDRTLQLVAAASVGFATGLWLAGAPRLVTAAALVPAFALGGTIVSRPEPTSQPVH